MAILTSVSGANDREGMKMRLYRPNHFNVIFLIPIAMAMSDNGGCASSPKPGPLTKKQIEATLGGNTVQAADQEMYAFVDKDGTLRGLNTPKGTIGTWKVTDNDVLCAKWVQPTVQHEVCDLLSYTGDKSYEWNGNSLMVIKGNPKNL